MLRPAATLVIVLIGTGCTHSNTARRDRGTAAGPVASATVAAHPAAALAAAAGAFPASLGGSRAAPAPAQAGAARAIPGTDAAIQRWFLNNGAVKVRFNDALLRAETAVASGDTTGCQPLGAEARALSSVLSALGRLSPAGEKLAAAMQAPLTSFEAAASACVNKDFPTAQNALNSGVAQQAEAQEAVDEILDGDR
jgi:hypothetical protein